MIDEIQPKRKFKDIVQCPFKWAVKEEIDIPKPFFFFYTPSLQNPA